MDAYVQLALLEKARRVFSVGDDTFLSFPVLAPLTMTADALAAVAAPQTGSDLAAAADFARMVNFIPRDTVATIDGGGTLWELYGEVLSRAQVGEGVDDPTAKQRYDAAVAFLYQDSTDGLRQETETYRSYRQYRDAWISAQEDFRAKQLTGQTSTDSAVQQQWAEQEPVLRAHIAAAEADWGTLGHRAEVEAALTIVESANSANPLLRWRDWRNAFNPDIDMLTDSAGGRFAPTGYSPVNLKEATAWSRFELSESEVTALVAEAPEELRNALRDDPDPITQVAFDYRSVVLTRPWFSAAALTSRIWRLPDGDNALSDGAQPPGGRCPAYVAALVLMRNLEVHRPSGTAGGEGAVSLDPLVFRIPPHLLTKRLLPPPEEENQKWKLRTEVLKGFTVEADPQLIAPEEVTKFRPITSREFQATNKIAAVDKGLLSTTALRASGIGFTSLVEKQPGLLLRSRLRNPAWRDAILAEGVGINVGAVDATPPPPEPAPPAPVPQPSTDDITVLAFICKRLPKTPDPLPDMHW
ncbi:MAG TPA: hypothetical protein VL634_15915 [Mycobacterium sp.]|jgi:hypothetical protein|nr:hypothetical protein [Mycobacterium sp.]